MEKKINDKVCGPVADCNQLNQEMVRKDSPEGVVAICDNLSHNAVESRILTVRGVQVMLDRDLAELYGVPTSRLNEQSKRNHKRFPEPQVRHSSLNKSTLTHVRMGCGGAECALGPYSDPQRTAGWHRDYCDADERALLARNCEIT